MVDGTTLSVPPVHLPLIHGEDHLSGLAVLIPDPVVLIKMERNPSFRAAILSNPFLIREVSVNHALLNMLVGNPALLDAVVSNPGILRAIKESPAILAEILRNPGQSIETILQNISERNKLNQPERNIKNIAQKKPTLPQVLHTSEKPTVVMTKIPLEIKEAIAKVGLKIPININIPNVKTIKGKVQTKIPLIGKQSAAIYIDPKTLAMHPALLILLAATAFSASRTKIASRQEELETQSERQLTTLQEVEQVKEVEEAQEPKLVR